MVYFYTREKHRKTSGFLMCSEGLKNVHPAGNCTFKFKVETLEQGVKYV